MASVLSEFAPWIQVRGSQRFWKQKGVTRHKVYKHLTKWLTHILTVWVWVASLPFAFLFSPSLPFLLLPVKVLKRLKNKIKRTHDVTIHTVAWPNTFITSSLHYCNTIHFPSKSLFSAWSSHVKLQPTPSMVSLFTFKCNDYIIKGWQWQRRHLKTL